MPPSVIADAIVKLLRKPKTHLTVPTATRFVVAFTSMLGPRGRRWMNRRLGTDTLFLDFDTTTRRAYEDRAQSAVGIDDGTANSDDTTKDQ